ncbi:Dopamine N-acetyltransferase [Frankliniella fusca]|uniref:aralkylamine N-acetyltransferase n=1 Tax=Frankliniella fusca TaxID=407009 RepID=A0AAE1LXY3_9NEOP|nr:Dopamine N-acetyltransferase [Frankliniella fusca]
MAVQLQQQTRTSPFVFPDIRSSLPDIPVAEATDNRTFEVVRLGGKDRPRVTAFLRKFFYHDEPLNVAIGLKPGDRSPDLEDFSLSTLDEGISVGAVAADGTLVGVCINGILSREEDEEGRREALKEADDVPEDVTALRDPDEKFGQVKRLLMRTSAAGNVFAQVPADVDKIFDIFILSVDQSWRGKGIAKKLLDHSREIAQSEQHKLIRVICTSFVSALIVSRLGYRCIDRQEYKQFVDKKGQRLFPTPPPHDAATTYVLDL